MEDAGRAVGGKAMEERERERGEQVAEQASKVEAEQGVSVDVVSGDVQVQDAEKKVGDLRIQINIPEVKGPMSEKEEKAVEALLLLDEDLAAGSWSPVREKEIFFFPKANRPHHAENSSKDKHLSRSSPARSSWEMRVNQTPKDLREESFDEVNTMRESIVRDLKWIQDNEDEHIMEIVMPRVISLDHEIVSRGKEAPHVSEKSQIDQEKRNIGSNHPEQQTVDEKEEQSPNSTECIKNEQLIARMLSSDPSRMLSSDPSSPPGLTSKAVMNIRSLSSKTAKQVYTKVGYPRSVSVLSKRSDADRSGGERTRSERLMTAPTRNRSHETGSEASSPASRDAPSRAGRQTGQGIHFEQAREQFRTLVMPSRQAWANFGEQAGVHRRLSSEGNSLEANQRGRRPAGLTVQRLDLQFGIENFGGVADRIRGYTREADRNSSATRNALKPRPLKTNNALAVLHSNAPVR